MLKRVVLVVLTILGCATSAHSQAWEGSRTMQTETLQHDGMTRSFHLYDPSEAPSQALVIMLHGGGGNGRGGAMMAGFNGLADREGFIVVYPNGSGRLPDETLTWNVRHCCGWSLHNDPDDVGFISKLIDRLIETHDVDPQRVYVTGMSNGGMMSHRVAIDLSVKIAAIAPVVGALFGDETMPAGPVAAMIVTGALDGVVPPEGGRVFKRQDERTADRDFAPAIRQATFWGQANGCAKQKDLHYKNSEAMGDVIEFSDCRKGADVMYYLLRNNGHAWPGGRRGSERGDVPTQDMNASEAIWAFFKAHPKSPG
ncbi:MAG: PHB depolymerase family esterase [Alphaproteobacteria bacterium]|nr:PHB depolymerase family esterase [Alphaproteobacteria bacterium]